MQPINLGIIGTGIAARDLHWPALRRMPEKFTIKAVCNHTEEKAKEFSRMVGGVPYVTDYRQLLEMPEIDAVDITLPIELNYEVVKAAMQAGKDLIVEKPLAASLPQAEELVELEKDFARVAMVAEQFRYRSRFQRIKTLLGEGRIGEPEAVFWNGFTRTDPTNKYAQTKWRLHHQYPGGFVTDGGVRAGLPRPTARLLAAQTALGSAKMVLESGEHPAALKDAVTTPGGTTIAALHVLETAGIRGTLMDAVLAAQQRAREMI